MDRESQMTDAELLQWLARNGTEVSQAELEENFPRVLAAVERNVVAKAEPYHGWFGTSWGAPINEVQPHVSTPVGEDCLFCHEPIREGDQGYVMPFNDESEGLMRVASHKRCQHRALGISEPRP
jgi:hypothetical protein